jgi:diguanylate cyclase (GGDEF)-like protein
MTSQRRPHPSLADDIIDELPIAVLIFVDGQLVRVNDGWTALTGLDSSHSAGQQWRAVVDERDRHVIDGLLTPAESARIGAADMRLEVEHRPEEVWVHARSRHAGDEDRETCVITLSEIGAQKSNELQLLHRATHDELTGLTNRVEFMTRLEALLVGDTSSARPTAVAFIDLNGFKSINDQRGHAVGDTLLQSVARRLQQAVRPSDTVGRLGGDEFAIIFPGVRETAQAVRLADRIINVLEAPVSAGATEVAVGVSVGIALSGGDDESAAALLERADHAMYRAKASGGSRWVLAGAEDLPTAVPAADLDGFDEAVEELRSLMAAIEQRVLVVLESSTAVDDPDIVRLATIGQLVTQLWSEIEELSTERDGRA